MNWKTNYETGKNFSICAVTFEAESKKEIKYAKKMNAFYRKITEEAKKITKKDKFPEGGKYYIEIQAADNNGLIDVYISVRLKIKGKTHHAFKDRNTWEKGLVCKQKAHIKTNGIIAQ